MKNKVNPVAIGMFVIGAAFIAVSAVMVFGAAKFFAKTQTFISYFSESVNGLDVGAPLKYKGVTIGKVERIMISTVKGTIRESSVAVVYSIDINLLRRRSAQAVGDFESWLDKQISDGLRAKLNYQSIVTGMLYIELDFLADAGEKFSYHYKGAMPYTEIPSAASGLPELAKAVEKTIKQIAEIDFKTIGENAKNLLVHTDELITDSEVRNAPKNLNKLLVHIDEVVSNPEVRDAPKNLNVLLRNTDKFLFSADTELKNLSAAGQKTFANVDSVLKNVNTIVAPQSPLRYELALMIRTLNDSLNSISNLTDYLERNPSALLTGKLDKNETSKNEK